MAILLVAGMVARYHATTTAMTTSQVPLPHHPLGVPCRWNRRRPISYVWQTRDPDVNVQKVAMQTSATAPAPLPCRRLGSLLPPSRQSVRQTRLSQHFLPLNYRPIPSLGPLRVSRRCRLRMGFLLGHAGLAGIPRLASDRCSGEEIRSDALGV